MADTPAPDAVVKRETETPERDPIVSRSTSGIILVCALLLIGVTAWALYDEAYGQRPWKRAQQEFVQRYTRYLKSIKKHEAKARAGQLCANYPGQRWGACEIAAAAARTARNGQIPAILGLRRLANGADPLVDGTTPPKNTARAMSSCSSRSTVRPSKRT